jgi:hypothetical protein
MICFSRPSFMAYPMEFIIKEDVQNPMFLNDRNLNPLNTSLMRFCSFQVFRITNWYS